MPQPLGNPISGLGNPISGPRRRIAAGAPVVADYLRDLRDQAGWRRTPIVAGPKVIGSRARDAATAIRAKTSL